ncbi:MAG: N-acetylmuramoyl-L-alanine amidase [Roseburia sp.]|nr:N-acetylmuramoyl-L-alanine amidase [Roseburia sp.]MCM1098827.1 N-acetylmuramoyl-L-alanine amidase [Ruminococcus flavefaciens]
MRRLFLPVTPLLSGAICFFLLLSAPALDAQAAERLQELPERPVIVIDPGHGGENQGTIEGNQDEKYMTMTTALAMYEELCKYDDVEVYLTRTEDIELSMEERAGFAASVNADFLFSVHYNASEYHELFGAEIWIPLEAPYNSYGYQFGHVFLSAMREQGLFLRGIKTRQGSRGDYYGIIRETVNLGIPAVILEHCHVDEERDSGYCDSEEDLIRFGREDATAVAKYFGLKSRQLQVDYSDYPLEEADDRYPVASTLQDGTPPDVCLLEFVTADYGTGLLRLNVSAADYDSPLLYYDYSLDGGATYSERIAWPGSDALSGSYEDTFTLDLTIPEMTAPSVVLRAYNLFDLCTASSPYNSLQIFRYTSAAGENSGGENGNQTGGKLGDGGALNEGAGERAENAPGGGEFSDEGENGTAVRRDTSDENANGATGTGGGLGTASGRDGDFVPAMAEEADESEPVSFLTFLEICLGVVAALFVILLISQTIVYWKRRKRRRQRRNVDGAARNQQR